MAKAESQFMGLVFDVVAVVHPTMFLTNRKSQGLGRTVRVRRAPTSSEVIDEIV